LLIFETEIRWTMCSRPQPRHESMMHAVLSFSLLSIYSARTLSCVRKCFKKVCFVLCIYLQLFS